jgi:hypothetical protein
VSHIDSPPIHSIRLAALNYREPPMDLPGLDRRVVETSRQQLANRPNVFGQALRHRWRRPQRLMHAAEIVVRDV